MANTMQELHAEGGTGVDWHNANYPHIPSPNNIYADGIAIGRPDPRDAHNITSFNPMGAPSFNR